MRKKRQKVPKTLQKVPKTLQIVPETLQIVPEAKFHGKTGEYYPVQNDSGF